MSRLSRQLFESDKQFLRTCLSIFLRKKINVLRVPLKNTVCVCITLCNLSSLTYITFLLFASTGLLALSSRTLGSRVNFRRLIFLDLIILLLLLWWWWCVYCVWVWLFVTYYGFTFLNLSISYIPYILHICMETRVSLTTVYALWAHPMIVLHQ